MKRTIRWGIIGLGKIANKFAQDILLSEQAVLQAVASRNLNKAQSFAQQYHATTYYDSYEALAADPEIDVVYIATPHPFHFDHTMLCLRHQKAVLCEKPMGMDAQQVQTMIAEAAKQQVFLMEGIWTRFIPATEKVLQLLNEKAIGSLHTVRADFGFKPSFDPTSRIYDKALGAGSLLDIGIYPLYLSLLTLGMPSEIKALARMTDTGVDSYCAMLLDYPNGAKANLESTIEAQTPTEAFLYGNKGSLQLHTRFHHAQKLTLTQEGQTTVLEVPYTGNGYYHEIEEVHRCLQEGLIESPKLPLSLSTDLSALLDQVRAQIGLHYDV